MMRGLMCVDDVWVSVLQGLKSTSNVHRKRKGKL